MIVDCDPGHDDAVAIVTAAHAADVVGIVTVGGNVDIDRTTYNALVIRDLVGLDAPVHRGAGHPIMSVPRHAPAIHGESGLDGADLPAPVTPLDGVDGVEFIIETCRAEAGLWLVPTGPLTNVGLAFRLAPDLPEQIAGVSLMGGGSFGNRSAVAEFNIWADPHAAAIVFDTYDPGTPGSAAGRLIMAGLDVTHRFQVTPERIERTREIPGRLAEVLAGLSSSSRGRTWPGTMPDRWSAPHCTTRWRCWRSPTPSCSGATTATSWSRPPVDTRPA